MTKKLNNVPVNAVRAEKHLMDLLKVEGLSGREKDVAELVKKKLIAAGCKKSWIRHDKANKKIPGDYQIGNMIVKLPGTRKGRPRLFMGHLDTVPLCRGAVPVKKGRRIVSKAKTALGADNRTAVGCLVTLAETLLRHKLDHPPITLLFTVGEEVGLWGARFVNVRDLGSPEWGVNIDSGDPAQIIIGAVGADRWHVNVHGRSSHAGSHPEDGVSATLIASRAIEDVAAQGFFGRVVKGRQRGTSNVGIFEGGEATNQVTDHVYIKGESRSFQPKFVDRITSVYRKAFEKAAKKTKNAAGRAGKVQFTCERDYSPFELKKTETVVKVAQAVGNAHGLKTTLVKAEGGLDANYLVEKGLPTITIGAGQHGAHTVDEYVNLTEYIDGCRYAVAMATC